MLDYIKRMEDKSKTQGLSATDIQTAVYELKDLLRGSIITDSPQETLRVFNAITSMQSARVLLVKNGFMLMMLLWKTCQIKFPSAAPFAMKR